jgi:signal transduction histidine kinase/CheY-like chemotaxis protein
MFAIQRNADAILFAVAGGISALLALFAWHRRAMPRAPAFGAMMAGETAWALGEALELIAVDKPVKLLFLNLRVLGALTTVLGLLAFVLHYTGRSRWLEPCRFGLICAPCLVLALLAWTDPWHHLYWAGTEMRQVGRLQLLFRSYGPGFWASFAYAYCLVGVSTILLSAAIAKTAGVYRAQAAIMLFGVLAPWVVSIIDMTHALGVIYVDATAATFTFTGLAFLPGLARLQLLELTPVALAAVVQRMNDPVFVIDRLGRIADLNPAAERWLVRPAHDVLGIDATRVFDECAVLRDRLQSINEQQESRFEIDLSAAVFDASISRLGEGKNSAGWALVLRNVTRLKSAEQERAAMIAEQTARAEAEAANRAKDRFLATLSHELRTPLTPVLATVTAMLGDASTPASLRPVLEMIRRNIDLEARLIDDLLDLTRIRRSELPLRRAIIDAHEQIDLVLDICADDAHNADLTLISQLKAEFHHADADPARFQQVLWNLLKNAIKFSPEGGVITFRSLNRIRESGEVEDDWLVIEVTDQGIGIEPETLPRIFNMFEEGGSPTARTFGGLGLGLTISRSIVEQHGGRLVAASAGRGKGTTMAIEIPTAQAPRARTPLQPPPPHIARHPRSLRILLVEDNKDTLGYLAAMLTKRGHDIRTAGNLAAALRVAREVEVEFLISDIELPDGSGLELMRRLRRQSALPGIALSGFGTSDDIEQSHSAGFAVHLTKPVDFMRLEEAISILAERLPPATLVDR